MKKQPSRVVLVTGSSRGIGAAIAERFCDAGDAVILIGRTRNTLTRAARRLGDRNGAERVLALAGDAANERFAAAVFAAAARRFGPVDILVNNAAHLHVGPLARTSAAQWDRTMAVNLRGPFLFSREMLRQPRGRGRRLIVNISSLGGVTGTAKFPGLAAYTASKAGLGGLTEATAVEGRPLNVDVLAVAPGAVDTDMLRRAAPHLKPGAVPRDIADVVWALAQAPSTAALSGAVIPLDTNR